MIRRCVAFTALGFFSLAPFCAAVPLTRIVDDHTAFALTITDTPALMSGWDASAFARSWGDPAIVKFFAPLRATMKIDEWDTQCEAATGLTLRGLLALAKGESLIAFSAEGIVKMANSDGDNAPPFLIAIQVGDNVGIIEKLLADVATKENTPDIIETYADVPVHMQPQKPSAKADDASAHDAETNASSVTPDKVAPDEFLAWAFVDGTWLISFNKERVFAAVDALKAGGVTSPLANSDRFQSARAHIGESQALFYLDVSNVYPVIRDAVLARQAAKGQPSPMGISPQAMFNAFGLDEIGVMYASLGFDEKETRLDAGLTWETERGLLKLFAFTNGSRVMPTWIPARWTSVSSTHFSMSAMYSGIEELLESVSPALSGMAQGQLRTFNKNLGTDIKRDLIGSLGDVIISAVAQPVGLAPDARPAIDEMEQFFAVSLDNPEAFTNAIEALKRLAGPSADQLFVKRDYLGNALYTFTPPATKGAPAGKGFSYVVVNRMFMVSVGSPTTIENALQGMASNQPSFWDRPEVQAELAHMPTEVSSLQVQDLRVTLETAVETFARMQSNIAGQALIDPEARPEADVIARYWGLSSGYSEKTAKGFHARTRLPHPQP
jgi:hypothetical protein